jgi:hypothetical protein
MLSSFYSLRRMPERLRVLKSMSRDGRFEPGIPVADFLDDWKMITGACPPVSRGLTPRF